MITDQRDTAWSLDGWEYLGKLLHLERLVINEVGTAERGNGREDMRLRGAREHGDMHVVSQTRQAQGLLGS